MDPLEAKPRILIVDDNPNIHRDFELVFDPESRNQELEADERKVFGGSPAAATDQGNYELHHALSGLEAVEKVKQSIATGDNYQLAFVDIRMPGIDGVETIARIWKIDPAMQIVICTAFADYSQEDLSAKLGQTDKLLVLKKPFDTIEVTQLAGTLTAKWFLARQAALKMEQMELLVARRTEKLLALQQREAQRIHELDQMKLQFLNNFLNEFRTPLTLLVAGVDQLADDDKAGAKESLRSDADRLLHLVNQLADLHALNGEEPAVEILPGDMVVFLQGVIGIFQSTAERQKVGLQFHTAEDSGLINFDAGKLEKALFLILSEALQTISTGGNITVTLDLGETVHITIKNTGGRTAQAIDEQPILWLTLARNLIESQGGTVVLENIASNQPLAAGSSGSQFSIRLPLKKVSVGRESSSSGQAKKSAQKSAAAGSEEFDEAVGGKEEFPALLIIEADQGLRRHIRQGFEAEYRIAETAESAEGFKMARDTMPDLIIADVPAAWKEGITLCRKLKSDVLTSHIPVVLLANYGDDQHQLEALETGADEFIGKPFRMSLLKARAANLLEARRRILERFGSASKLIPREAAVNQMDLQFIRRVMEVVERNLSDFEFDVDALAREIFVSRRQLFRKIKAVTGNTPNILIRSVRLNRAAQLLKESRLTVSEITYAVGFSDLKHFREVFREQFGVLPGDYLGHAGDSTSS